MKIDVIILILVIGIIGVSTGFLIPAVIAEKHPRHVDVAKGEETRIDYVNYTDFTLLVSVGENVCIGCHLSGKRFIPQAYEIKDHARGGAYCLKCHKISHEKHPVNANVTCEKCHGDTTPKIPSPTDGKIACDNCHAFPDALLPSSGNLISIHQPRGVSCITCHIDCAKCHEKSLTDGKWDKRTNHFNTLLGTYK